MVAYGVYAAAASRLINAQFTPPARPDKTVALDSRSEARDVFRLETFLSTTVCRVTADATVLPGLAGDVNCSWIRETIVRVERTQLRSPDY